LEDKARIFAELSLQRVAEYSSSLALITKDPIVNAESLVPVQGVLRPRTLSTKSLKTPAWVL
jgi:hypothetical protein